MYFNGFFSTVKNVFLTVFVISWSTYSSTSSVSPIEYKSRYKFGNCIKEHKISQSTHSESSWSHMCATEAISVTVRRSLSKVIPLVLSRVLHCRSVRSRAMESVFWRGCLVNVYYIFVACHVGRAILFHCPIRYGILCIRFLVEEKILCGFLIVYFYDYFFLFEHGSSRCISHGCSGLFPADSSVILDCNLRNDSWCLKICALIRYISASLKLTVHLKMMHRKWCKCPVSLIKLGLREWHGWELYLST